MSSRGRVGGGTASSVQRSRRVSLTESRPPKGALTIELIDDTGRAVPFECFDLSAVGAYLYSDLLLSPGDIVQLRLRLPWTARPIHVRGEVVRAEHDADSDQRPGMGVAFRDLSPEVERELRTYVARRFFRHVTSR